MTDFGELCTNAREGARPYPEERALARVSKDGRESLALRPSFETLASQAPQDEVNILHRL